MNGHEEPLVKPPHEEPAGHERVDEERAIVAATELVLPREQIERLAVVSQSYNTEIQQLDLRQGAQTELALVETRGRQALAGGDSPPPAPSQPDAAVLQRRGRFRDTSRSATPTSPQISGDLGNARLNIGMQELLHFSNEMVIDQATRAQNEATLRTYGSSVEELFSDVFVTADGPGVNDVQRKVLQELAPQLTELRTALTKLQSLARTSPVDTVALGAAAHDLLQRLKDLHDQLSGPKVGVAVTELGAQFLALSAVAGFCGDFLKAIIGKQPVNLLNPGRRALDLGGRLRFVGELPCSARDKALRAAQADYDKKFVHYDKELAAQTRRKAELAAIPPGTDPPREQQLKLDIQNGVSELTRLQNRFGTAAKEVSSRQRDLVPIREAMNKAYQSLIEGGSTRRAWSSELKKVIAELKGLKANSLDPQRRDEIVTALLGLDGTLDVNLVKLVEQLCSATPANLDQLLDSSWEYTREVSRMMEVMTRLFASTPLNAVVLDPLRVRLQAMLAALAAYLSERALMRIRV